MSDTSTGAPTLASRVLDLHTMVRAEFAKYDPDAALALDALLWDGKTSTTQQLVLLRAIEAVAQGGMVGGPAYGWRAAALAFLELVGASRPLTRKMLEAFARRIPKLDEAKLKLAGKWLMLIDAFALDAVHDASAGQAKLNEIAPAFSPFHVLSAQRQLGDFQLHSPEWKAARASRAEFARLLYLMDRLTTGAEVFRDTAE